MFKEQPSNYDVSEIGGIPKDLTEEQKEGIAIAAWICRQYKDGENFAEAIELWGEQKRALYWMKKESENDT